MKFLLLRSIWVKGSADHGADFSHAALGKRPRLSFDQLSFTNCVHEMPFDPRWARQARLAWLQAKSSGAVVPSRAEGHDQNGSDVVTPIAGIHRDYDYPVES